MGGTIAAKGARSGRVKQGVQCCFCEQTILVAGPDPCFLNLRTSDPEEKGAFQEMFCHAKCLMGHVRGVPFMFDYS